MNNATLDKFLAEVSEVCKRYDVEIGHEDSHGAFEVYDGFADFDHAVNKTRVTAEEIAELTSEQREAYAAVCAGLGGEVSDTVAQELAKLGLIYAYNRKLRRQPVNGFVFEGRGPTP